MTILEKIKYHHDNRKYCQIKRIVGKDSYEQSSGYIVDYSENFVLMHEVDDFLPEGYLIFTIQSVKEIKHTTGNKYYDKIIHLEGIIDKIENKHKPNLFTWTTIFQSIKKAGFNVIIENEDPEDESFDIGPITKVTANAVYVRYFDGEGFLSAQSTKITWNFITIAKFDDRYINIYSKYLREKKK
ncbi:hypothetical protein [Emticicia sp. C21]|uniref:hypothetical protein n=1 Tax=Emticicia sp. C21 TaxID=2302915 RepID=UPI000E34D564|nr:hypothetical protein [Emticicia sp. C21]RFS17601.1 hypothetical protein D0T08_07480 [Emticicia sp. C21]